MYLRVEVEVEAEGPAVLAPAAAALLLLLVLALAALTISVSVSGSGSPKMCSYWEELVVLSGREMVNFFWLRREDRAEDRGEVMEAEWGRREERLSDGVLEEADGEAVGADSMALELSRAVTQ